MVLTNVIASLLLTLSANAANDKPPDPYLDKGACPFACCTYREWTVSRDTTVYDKPAGNKVVAELKPKVKVTGVTGNVYIRPGRLEVVYPRFGFKKGDVIYVLTPIGEGMQKVWFEGKFSEVNTAVAHKGCKDKPGENCWAEILQDIDMRWWAQIKTTDGKTGWAEVMDNFSDMDACG